MEKLARKPSADPVQERLRADKAAWNKQVSSFINDLIHFKKTMNGWPSKFFKERARITQPIPADPGTIIGSLAGDFQEIANRGNAIIQEQVDYSKNRRQKLPKMSNTPGQGNGGSITAPTEQPQTPEGSKLDLTQQIGKQLAASPARLELVRVASVLEAKYFLESEASNPISRFFTRLKTPTINIGKGARERQLRMTMLKACVQTLKDLKKLQKEIVKSSKMSAKSSHNIMNALAKQWSAVTTSFRPYYEEKMGSKVSIDNTPQGEQEGGEEQEQEIEKENLPLYKMDLVKEIISDIKSSRDNFGNQFPRGLSVLIDQINVIPKAKRTNFVLSSNLVKVYQQAIAELNLKLGTDGNSLKEIANQFLKKQQPAASAPAVIAHPPEEDKLVTEAQLLKWLGKARHGLVPGGTSGRRLEIYRKIGELRKDLDQIMNLIQKGLDLPQLYVAITDFDKGVISLRKMTRSLFSSEFPNEAIPMSFF